VWRFIDANNLKPLLDMWIPDWR